MRRALLLALLCACKHAIPELDHPDPPLAAGCTWVGSGHGPGGEVPLDVSVVVDGLEVPWALAFLPDGALLVTERPGRLRLVHEGRLLPDSIATMPVASALEGGLLGLVLHPDFAQNRLFYVFRTAPEEHELEDDPYALAPSDLGLQEPASHGVNRIEQWRLAPDRRSAERVRVVVDDIPAFSFHDGGRLRIGPDGLLYASTGNAFVSALSQDPASLAGKILRVGLDGGVPGDNPLGAAIVTGIRNSQGFDWFDARTLLVVDHGPSGDLLRKGADEVNVATWGENLGWPVIFGCEARGEGLVAPRISWNDPAPPGSALIWRGSAIPAFQGSVIVPTLGSRLLARVVLAPDLSHVVKHEVYLRDAWGRLRAAEEGPDGALYLTTSNCDSRGDCPERGDVILRVVQR